MEDKNKELAAFDVGGVFTFQQIRNGKIIDEWEEKNLVVNEGLNHLLAAVLNGSTQVGTWYIGLFEGNYTPVSTDKAANIAANAVECTAYNETLRQRWSCNAPTGQSITNTSTKASFAINATKTIYGAFLISDSAKSGTTGTLFSASKFTAPRNVIIGDELLVTYTVSASST